MIQSILFDKHKWTIANAKKWLLNHGHKVIKVDISDNFLRFRQKTPNPNMRYRTIHIGNGIEFILMF